MATILEWAQFANASITTTTQALLEPSEAANLLALYPCLGASPLTTLVGDELEAYKELLGLSIGIASMQGSTAAASTTGVTIEVGHVKEAPTTTGGTSSSPALSNRLKLAAQRIACIKAVPAIDGGGLTKFSGKARSTSTCGCSSVYPTRLLRQS